MESLKPLWTQLEAEALTLNGEADSLVQIMRALEAKLLDLQLEIETTMEIAQRRVAGIEQDVDVHTVVTCLRYCAADGRWGLWIQEIGYDSNELPILEGPLKHLTDCDKNIAIEALGSFERLLKTLELEAQRRTQRIRQAKSVLCDPNDEVESRVAF